MKVEKALGLKPPPDPSVTPDFVGLSTPGLSDPGRGRLPRSPSVLCSLLFWESAPSKCHRLASRCDAILAWGGGGGRKYRQRGELSPVKLAPSLADV